MKYPFRSGLVVLLMFLLWQAGCRRPENPKTEGSLRLSTDTVAFDTIFTTLLTPTKRLIFTNTSGHDMLVSSVKLEKGAASEFSMIVDGIAADEVKDLVLAKGDSAIIFINCKSFDRDTYARDRILLTIGSNTQFAIVEAFIRDAYFISYREVCDTTLTPGKPIVVDGILQVAEGCTLTIQAGTHIFFSEDKYDFVPISMINVLGTLIVQGTPSNPVIMEGNRLDEDYKELPGQWRGIRFFKTSQDNVIEGLLLKNAVAGIEVDSMSTSALKPKVLVRQSEIRNCSSYGILGIGFSAPGSTNMLEMENCLVHNCKEHVAALVYGGQYAFYNCTFANYGIDFSRNSSMVGFQNYYSTTAYILDANFTNCIIWGSEEEEIAFDTAAIGGALNVTFNKTWLRSTAFLKGDFVRNVDPGFTDPTKSEVIERNYKLQSWSPGINGGLDLSSRFTTDLTGASRSLPFDAGAYEYVP